MVKLIEHKEFKKSNPYSEFDIHYYLIVENEKGYIYIQDDSEEEDGIMYCFHNKLELLHRYKEKEKQSFTNHIDADKRSKAKFYQSYSDRDSRISARNFGLIELSAEDIQDYLHLII